MKKIIILIGLFFPIFLLAQNSQGTTHDEYKYLSKGYAYQKEMGLDGGKAGYSVKALFSASNGVAFRGLFSNQSQLKGLVVIINPEVEKPIYLGLPTNGTSAEVKNLAERDFKEKLNLNAKEKYDKALLEFTMYQLGDGEVATSYIGETEKNLKSNVPSSANPVEEYSTVVPLKFEKSERLTERSGMTTTKNVKVNNKVHTEHNFSEREMVQPPIVKGEAPAFGKVVIKMCIDRNGNVKTAKFTQRGSTTFNDKLRKMSLAAAKGTKFSEGLDAEQCGTISFEYSPK